MVSLRKETVMTIFEVLTTGGTPFDAFIQRSALKIRKRLFKKKYRHPDAISNIERLYELMQEGAITKEDFEELKQILKKRI